MDNLDHIMNITPYFIAFIATIISILVYRPLADRLGLVDIPSERKQHRGNIPLIGGLSMFIGISLGLFISDNINNEPSLIFFFIGSFVLVLVGLIDDYRGVSSSKRIFIQVLVAFMVVKFGGVLLFDLGKLISTEHLYLGIFSIIFSIFAIVGVINSLNFSDGIDGLSASLSLVTFFSVAFFANTAQHNYAFSLVFLFITSIVAFLIFNIGLGKNSKFKIFMGDAGSTFLGLGVAWSLVSFSQGDIIIFSPVIALWIFAVPLMDTLFVMMNRVTNGKSPFSPDRRHLHHFFINSGRTDREALLIIVIFSILMALTGILMELNEVSERVMFFLFLTVSLIYYLVLRHRWKLIHSIDID
jgi:UDP-GlcNAc:undecaprenyl-phosphate GlcNAc-1-phosphate transferase